MQRIGCKPFSNRQIDCEGVVITSVNYPSRGFIAHLLFESFIHTGLLRFREWVVAIVLPKKSLTEICKSFFPTGCQSIKYGLLGQPIEYYSISAHESRLWEGKG